MIVERTFFMLGTVNTISIYNEDENKAIEVIESVCARIEEIDDRMSAFKDESDICRIKNAAGNELVQVHQDTFEIIKKAVELSEITEGAFDITMRPLVELWGIKNKNGFIPNEDQIKRIKEFVDYRDIVFDEETCKVGLKKSGQAIDLGGIAKGYAADEARRIISEGQIKNAIINFGGNVVTIGKQQDGKEWRIGIQNPNSGTGDFIATLDLSDMSVVTSGSNEQFFIKDGIRYHHIINPATGYPADSNLLSVTAVTKDSMEGDALTTALFILGPEKSALLIEQLKIDAVFITEKMEVLVTPGLNERFRIAV